MKGFTLIELLAVIVIIGALTLLSVPLIRGYVEKSRIDAFLITNKMVLKAANSYLLENDNLVPKNVGETLEIPLQTLISDKYIGLVKSQFNNNDCTGYVLVTKTEKKIMSTPHINCLENINTSIADGLVFDYKFDDFQEPTDNFIINSNSLNPASFNSYGFGDSSTETSITLGHEQYKGSNTLKVSRLAAHSFMTAVTTSIKAPYITFTQGESVTYSGYIKAGTSGMIGRDVHVHVYGNKTPSGNFSLGTTSNIKLSSSWQRFEATIINNEASSWTTTNVYFRISTDGLANGEYFLMSSPQLEKKTSSTPFTPDVRFGIVKDYSKNSNIATLTQTNTPKWISENNKRKGVYSFNGNGNYIEMDNSQNLNIQNQGTISLFAKTNRTHPSNDGTIAYKGLISKSISGGAGGWSFFIDWNGTNATRTLRASIGNATNANYVSVPNFNFNNEWQNIVFTWSGTRLKLYSNGKLIGESAQTINPQNMLKTIEVGRAFSHNGYGFEGLLDDVKLYNRALSDKEVELQYELNK